MSPFNTAERGKLKETKPLKQRNILQSTQR